MSRILPVLTIVLLAAPAWAQSVVLNWNAVTEDINGQPEQILGYHVDYGTTQGGPYAFGFSTADVLTANVDDLVNGDHYYFVVKAIDTSSNESGYSNEADIVVPFEDCNNLLDDDHDGLTDCEDLECPDGTEVCDGFDNDCDGTADNHLSPPACPLQNGVCAGSTQTCAGATGWQACDASSYGSDYEQTESICDGLDNDCNNALDDNLSPPPCALQLGVCQGSIRPCNGSSGWGVCDAADYGADYEVSESLCDGLDNDCDGTTDTGLSGPACPLQLGVCAGSTQECGPGGWQACDDNSYGSDYQQAESSCDGLDNDCDDSVDEGLTAPLCPLQLGVCSGAVRTCNGAAGWSDCSAGEYGADFEIQEVTCDGLDNDCDGSDDDNLSGPACPLQVGVCAGSTQTCAGSSGWQTCDAVAYGANFETDETICDGLDNDCDGSNDEDLIGPLCVLQLGVCSGTRRVCAGAGGFVACDASVYGLDYQLDESLCDNLDNDCDGLTDEDCPCSQGEIKPCSFNEGDCLAGTQECDQNGAWGECSGVLPTGENCDGHDNDCNTIVDDLTGPDCPLQNGVCAGSTQLCGGAAGFLPCNSDAYGIDYEQEELTCDGLDNDCDGAADENLNGPVCPFQMGVCAGSRRLCAGQTGWTECDADSYGDDYEADETRCDNLDNDCDGSTDEDLVGPACPLQAGVCAGSVQRCGAQDWLPCDATDYGVDFEVEEESCDGLDNDCDGAADQGLDPPFCALQLGICSGSQRPCLGAQGFGDCGLSDYGASYQQVETLCDGIDNDCDAITDEDCPCSQAETKSCSVDEGECRVGVQDCDQDGNWGECNGVLPAEEVCDGLDNNCDGSTDENLTPTNCPLQEGVCAGALQACRGTAGWQCDAETYGANYEQEEYSCDDLDNDCDGLTDENGCGHDDGGQADAGPDLPTKVMGGCGCGNRPDSSFWYFSPLLAFIWLGRRRSRA
ncbi:MAG TPA: fibronectin type III domain-containing protein [Myxococcota bacterium]|nr:fibronectin type III domain-containing protein [Myxococcota bacterium]